MMNKYQADLHIHTVLSPCGSLQMSPDTIIQRAKEQKLDIIGIADHNTTLQAPLIKRLAEESGILALCGVEINTKEEVHCLAFFENDDELNQFQKYLDDNLPVVKNKPELFGDQVWVDEENNIVGEEERLLIIGLNRSLDEVAAEVKRLNGIFIPAHVDKPRFSVTSQLGFLAADVPVTCLEVSRNVKLEEFRGKHKWVENYNLISSSDAHIPEDIGKAYVTLQLESMSFQEVKKALEGRENRKILELNIKI